MKKCFKCGAEKPIEEFYTHRKMADGHMGKCITCTRSDAKNHIRIKRQDLSWVIREARRKRKSQNARRLIKKDNYPNEKRIIINRKWKSRNRHKTRAHNIANKAIQKGLIAKVEKCNRCPATGLMHKHHHDYDKPLEIEWLCPKCHGLIHRKYEKEIRDRG